MMTKRKALIKALIIDDSEDIRWVLCRALEKHNVETVEARDGEDGIELLDEDFDVVVTDVSMPKADGFAVLRHARELYPNMPVVMISGSWSNDERASARELGATRILDKPIDIASFGRTIKEVLAARDPALATEREGPELDESEPVINSTGPDAGRRREKLYGCVAFSEPTAILV